MFDTHVIAIQCRKIVYRMSDSSCFNRLSSTLGDEQLPLVPKFISALEHMSQPDQIFKVHLHVCVHERKHGTCFIRNST